MFWQCHIVTSSIDKLFDKPEDELKLEDFLDESDLIQECLNQNKRLLDYLIQENVMNQLIHHIIHLPNDNNFRYANIVSELLSGDFQSIQERLINTTHLDLLYSFLLINNETLNPILASYFSRIITTLIARRPIDIINYLKSRETFKDDFLRHLDSTSIIDIIFRLISDCGEQRSDTIKWYEDINLIDGLMQQFFNTESYSIQINVANLLSEFLRLAFDQQIGNDCDIIGSTLSSTIERLLYNRNEHNEGSSSSNHLSSDENEEKNSTHNPYEEKLTIIAFAQHILSKSNLEQLFDALIKRPILISNGYEFLHNIFDILNRHLSAPACVSFLSKHDDSLLNKNESEQMQINDDGNTSITNKSNENTSGVTDITKDSLLRIYVSLLEVIPSRLPSLVDLLSLPRAPLTQTTNDNIQNEKNKFISDPLGSIRLNLIKLFSKLIYTIANDNTGDNIYEVLISSNLFQKLIDLFLKHEYNNFLHTQVCVIIRLLININSIAMKQPNDIWTRTTIQNEYRSEFDKSSPYYYTNRYSYKLFQSLLRLSEINLFERLLDQYELNTASTNAVATSPLSDDANSSSLIHSSFVSPNSGHIAQLLRCLRDHSSVFSNYVSFFKSNDQQQIDEDTSVIEIRWQAALDYLAEEESKWAAMHHTERATSNFRINSSASYLAHLTETNDSDDTEETDQQQHIFHIRKFNKNETSYGNDDDDDDDEIERFDIDDELMKNDETSNERKLSEMKKMSFQIQFPSAFNEQSIWYQPDDMDDMKKSNYDDDDDDDNDNNRDKMKSTPTLPNLFENHRMQQENTSSNESNFEQLCSLRAHDTNNGSGLFPFQSSSTIRDEATLNNDKFWRNHPIYLNNRNKNQPLCMQSTSSSSDQDSDIDEDESKNDSNIPDDEKYFVYTDTETNEVIQPNNMMDIFSRQPVNTNEIINIKKNTNNEDNDLEDDLFERDERSNESHHSILSQIFSYREKNENHNDKNLTTQDEQQVSNENSNKDDDILLQDNFSFLIAKGMLRPASF